MRTKMEKLMVCVLALAVLLTAGTAQAARIEWDGGGVDDFWSTMENWDPNGLPTAADTVIQQVGDSVYDMLGDFSLAGNQELESEDANPVSMTFNQGVLETEGWLTQGMGDASGTGIGTYNIGGDANIIVGGGFSLANYTDSSSSGVLNISGGALRIASHCYIGASGGGGDNNGGLTGTLNMSGGAIFCGGNTYIGYIGLNGSGSVDMSGGMWYPNHLAMQNGKGTINLSGGYIAANYVTMSMTAGDTIDITGTGTLYARNDLENAYENVDAAIEAGYITAYGGTGTIIKVPHPDLPDMYYQYTAQTEFPGDINHDNTVDFLDFAELAADWGGTNYSTE